MHVPIALSLLSVLVIGCSQRAEPVPQFSNTVERSKAVQAAIDAGPTTRTWQTPEGALVELTIPMASIGGRRVEYQRCLVWRDAATRTASLDCDRDDIDLSDYPTDPVDYTDLK